MKDFLISLPLWVVFLVSLVPIIIKLLNQNREPHAGWPTALSAGGIGVSLICLWGVAPSDPREVLSLFSGALVLDSLRAQGTVLLQILALGVVLMQSRHPQVSFQKFSEVLFLKMGALLGLMLLLWAGDLLTAFVGLELASMAFYLLIALGRTGPGALKAAFMYFVLGSMASAFLLYGVALIFGSSGSFDWQEVVRGSPELISHSRLLLLGLVLVLAGFLFKITVFPFQFWMPDVYQHSLTPLVVFMAGGFKVSVFVLLFQWMKDLFVTVDLKVLLSVLQWMAVLSVLFGNIAALLQSDIKRVLLFSSVAHSGYLLMILIAGGMGAFVAGRALGYYLMVYVLMVTGAFICLKPFEHKGRAGVFVSDLRGLARKAPLQAALILLFLFNLAGFPPTAGFIGKVMIFEVLLDQGFWWMSFWLILGSAAGIFYYLRPVAAMYISPPALPKTSPAAPSQESRTLKSVTDKAQPPPTPSLGLVYTCLALGAGVWLLAGGLYPSLFF